MRFVLIGNGVAGITAARNIAQAASGSDIHVYTSEQYPYYPRPRLPELLAGTVAVKDLTFYDDAWYERRGIQVHLSTPVAVLTPGSHTVTLADGSEVPYDRLLLAAGARSFVPPITNADKLQGVFTMRNIDDVLAIRAYAAGKEKAVVIGGGLLGLEAARALRELGLDVTVVEFASYLLPRQLDKDGATILTAIMREAGLQVVANAATESILDDGAGKARGVALKGGQTLDADLVLVSAGVRSNLDLPRAAKIGVNKGVTTDVHMQTDTPDVYAAGDVAEFNGIVWGIVPAALEQGRVAALNMAGQETTYVDITPSNTLKVVGVDLTSIGTVNPQGEGFEELRHSDPAAGVYRKLVLRDGKLVGAILLGDPKPVGTVSKLVTTKADVAAYRADLLQDDFDWKQVAAEREA